MKKSTMLKDKLKRARDKQLDKLPVMKRSAARPEIEYHTDEREKGEESKPTQSDISIRQSAPVDHKATPTRSAGSGEIRSGRSQERVMKRVMSRSLSPTSSPTKDNSIDILDLAAGKQGMAWNAEGLESNLRKHRTAPHRKSLKISKGMFVDKHKEKEKEKGKEKEHNPSRIRSSTVPVLSKKMVEEELNAQIDQEKKEKEELKKNFHPDSTFSLFGYQISLERNFLAIFFVLIFFLLVLVSLVSGVIALGVCVVCLTMALSMYHVAVEKEKFYRDFYLEYHDAVSKGYRGKQISDDLVNGVLHRLWQSLAPTILDSQIPLLQYLIDANMPSMAEGAVRVVSMEAGTTPPTCTNCRVLDSSASNVIIIDVVAWLVSEDMSIALNAMLPGIKLGVEIKKISFNAPVRVIVTIVNPFEWVASFSVLGEIKLDVQIKPAIQIDPMMLPIVKDYIQSLIDNIISSNMYTFPKTLSLSLDGTYLPEFKPDSALAVPPPDAFTPEKSSKKTPELPITRIALVQLEDVELLEEGWSVVGNPIYPMEQPYDNPGMNILKGTLAAGASTISHMTTGRKEDLFQQYPYMICVRRDPDEKPISKLGVCFTRWGEHMPEGWHEAEVIQFKNKDSALHVAGSEVARGLGAALGINIQASPIHHLPTICFKKEITARKPLVDIYVCSSSMKWIYAFNYKHISKSLSGCFLGKLSGQDGTKVILTAKYKE